MSRSLRDGIDFLFTKKLRVHGDSSRFALQRVGHLAECIMGGALPCLKDVIIIIIYLLLLLFIFYCHTFTFEYINQLCDLQFTESRPFNAFKM